MSPCPTLKDLPACPADKSGWPWTEECSILPETMPDGSPWPRISIVTPSYNQGQFIEETIRSVLLQGYPDLEHIIIDGGSSDESVRIIRKYEQHLTFWTSAPDRGQSHAINKGLARCTGRIFNWINSDDLLCSGSLRRVAETWSANAGHLVAGATAVFGKDDLDRAITSSALSVRNFACSRQGDRNASAYCQPATFLPLDAVKKVGGVREDLHLVMDVILMIHLLPEFPVAYIPDVLARFRLHESSKTTTMGSLGFRLELVEALRAMPKCPDVTAGELRREHAQTLVSYADLEGSEGNISLALRHLVKALSISPTAAVAELYRKRPARRFLQKLLRTNHSNC